MLNELMELSRSLERCGVRYPVASSRITTPGKGAGLLIGLDKNGAMGRIDVVPNMAELWVYKKDNQNTWPAMKLKAPLWKVKNYGDVASLKEKPLEQRLQAMGELCEKSDCALDSRTQRNLRARLETLPRELEPSLSESDREGQALLELIRRGGLFVDRLETFPQDLLELVKAQWSAGSFTPADCDLLATLFFGKVNAKTKTLEPVDVPCAFDLADYARFGVRVADPAVGQALAERLPLEGEDAFDGRCALTGREGPCVRKHPQPNLPVVGQTFLMSMNKDADCHYRYGMIASSIFPTSQEIATRFYNMLGYLTRKEKEGVTWRAVPSHVKGRQDLLIAYLTSQPDCALSLAAIMTEADEDEQQEALYDVHTKRLCDALRTFAGGGDMSPQVRVLVLSQLDPGRRQVIVNKAWTVEHLIHALESWREGACNGPMIRIPVYDNQGGAKGPRWIRQSAPSPAQIMRLYQSQWIRGGGESADVIGCNLGELYEILLGDPARNQKQLGLFLHELLTRTIPLFSAIGMVLIRGDWKELKKGARGWAILTSVSLACILLHKLGHRKEQYMNGAAFNVGRFLGLADRLHKLYCEKVRDKGGSKQGHLPPQLLGNAYLMTALDNPERALAQICERIRIYQAWANTFQGMGAGLAHWMLGEMGKVASELARAPLPNRTDDAQKAQLLLGYLSRPATLPAEGEAETQDDSQG